MFTLLRRQYPAVARVLTHSVNLVFGPKSGFKNKCQPRPGFGVENEPCVELCFTMEFETNGCMSFLDVFVERCESGFVIGTYRKSTGTFSIATGPVSVRVII